MAEGMLDVCPLRIRYRVFQEVQVTTADQLREIVRYVQNRVLLVAEGGREIAFSPPTVEEMTAAGLDHDTASRLTSEPWWKEMIGDIVETPDFAEPEASAEVVLGYARDVVQEYIGKRFPLDT